MRNIKRIIRKIKLIITPRRIKFTLLGSLGLVLLGAAGFMLWWNFIFFPDDYELTRDLAKLKSDKKGFYVKKHDLMLELKMASLSGFSGKKETSSILKSYRDEGFLVKDDPYAAGKGNVSVYRAGTGHVGIWVDERSSMLMKPGALAKFAITAKSDGLVEFSTLSKGKGGKVKITVRSGRNVIAEKIFTVKGYKNIYDNSDVKMQFSNRGFEKSTDYTGWNNESLSIDPGVVKRGKLSLEVKALEGSEPIFLGNLNVLEKSKQKKYNVVYIIFDGVAPQLWSFHNSESELTPYMAEAAEKDYIVFDHMITMGNKTRISLSGLFTSRLPSETRHGINRNFIPPEEREVFYSMVNDGDFETFPSYLRKNGYISAQFGNSGFTVDLLGTGTDYGFERSYEFQYNPYDSLGISRHFFSFIRENKNRNFYAYCHYNTPHKPFFAPLKYFFRGVMGAPSKGLWRPDFMGAVSYTDDVYKNIHLMLKENGLLENTIVVVATDHGSGYELSRFDKGFQYNEYSRQIFILHLPDELKKKLKAPGGHREAYVSSMNISPTLLDLAGIKPAKQFHGKSFVPIINSDFKGAAWDSKIWCMGRKTVSLITPDLMKYIINGTDTKKYIDRKYDFFGEGKELPYEMLFDLRRDPEEKHNLIHQDSDILARMRKIYFDSDIHHPEKTVISFVPGDKSRKNIEIRIKSGSSIIRAELYDKNMKVLKTFASGKRKDNYRFALNGKPAVFIFEQFDDRSKLEFTILSNGKKIKGSAIHSTTMDLNLLSNPVKMNSVLDFRSHYSKRPAVLNGWEGVKGEDLSVRVSRIDLHRWIDMNRYDKTRISASMKETLKSWGYIQ